MAKSILDARVYMAGTDLSGITNAAALKLSSDIVDCTAFSDDYKDKLAGLSDVIADVSGFFSPTEDLMMNTQQSYHTAVLTLLPDTAGANGTTAFFFRPKYSQYTPLEGTVSNMATYKLHGEGAAPLVKGKVLASKSARTITASGTKYNLGAYSATQSLYGALHVFAASGTDPSLGASIAIADQINTVGVHTAGTGYSENDVLTVVQTGGSLGTVTVSSVGGGGAVTGVNVTTQGSGYAVATGLSTTVAPAGGSGCKINIQSITDTPVITFTVTGTTGFEWKADAGPITDVNFRAMWAILGTQPSFTFAIVAGVA